jgi:hypothetical protein
MMQILIWHFSNPSNNDNIYKNNNNNNNDDDKDGYNDDYDNGDMMILVRLIINISIHVHVIDFVWYAVTYSGQNDDYPSDCSRIGLVLLNSLLT